MHLVIGKYYRDNINRTLQYIGEKGNLFEFIYNSPIYNNPNGVNRLIKYSSNDPIIERFVLIEDDGNREDGEFPDSDDEDEDDDRIRNGPDTHFLYEDSDNEMDGGKVRRKKSLRKKSLRKKSLRKKSLRKKSKKRSSRKKRI